MPLSGEKHVSEEFQTMEVRLGSADLCPAEVMRSGTIVSTFVEVASERCRNFILADNRERDQGDSPPFLVCFLIVYDFVFQRAEVADDSHFFWPEMISIRSGPSLRCQQCSDAVHFEIEVLRAVRIVYLEIGKKSIPL